MQTRTSKNTSVNSSKLPKVYGKLNIDPYSTVIDYGCGKYVDHIKNEMNKRNVNWYGYDPYNQSDDENEMTQIHENDCDVIVCSNVLNVIDDDETVKGIINKIFSITKNVAISIYEGDKSGIGRETKPDKWQRNQKTVWYEELIKDLGYSVKRKGNIILGGKLC